ncbi:NAD-reducing hydrogenase subunit HoxH [Acidisarcina polymorpha]|uniref:NAD-reducing hydrogenase subunit HoxH n=1 Tax=Acidisarcina polymorpha TaxID=2211140 RepID=A0A2Z5G825_9BACT|nr:Ni/Fe hydrogenase subunit alpha [Acidisarcina polymorpha]AXC15119.1 NAD-reducing hydrogenase subunit HoxH [Acidisarcina polymorpha]
MSQTITIDPVTRLEGHGKITLKTNDQGEVSEAFFSVTQVRGFEKFTEGRPFYEMPGLMARICGICPVSHLLASAKACEAIMSVEIPPTAAKLRRALNMAQTIQSHALSFFYLASPDLLLGMDSDPAERNIFGVAKVNPELGRAGIGLRRFGQHIIELLGKKRIHPGWVVPGGVTEPLSAVKRDEILGLIPEAYANIHLALTWYKKIAERFRGEAESFANFRGAFLGMVSDDDGLEFTDGKLRLIDADGNVLLDNLEAAQFDDHFGEAVEPFSYMKFPYYKPLGYPDGAYRVGPLARLNIAKHAGTPLADAELKEFKQLANGPVLGSFYYHQARLIDILYGIEVVERIFTDPTILDTHVRATAGVNRLEGSGVAEAPRGTLMHHYKVDEKGQMLWANLVIATGQNNNAMNRGVLQAAQQYVKTDKLVDGMLNRVEAVIRTFDPCLSCSTHAFGQMPLIIELLAPDGTMLDEVRR